MGSASSLAIGLLALGLGVAGAEPPPSKATTDIRSAIDEAVQPLLKGKKGVGMVVAVIDRHGQHVFGYGGVAVNKGMAPDGDTIFEIGSITRNATRLAGTRRTSWCASGWVGTS